MISFVDGYFGWLGNQMFQYAATYVLARRRGVRAAFPRNRPDLHQVFKIDALDYDDRPGQLFEETRFDYDPAVKDLPDGTILSGYFQSERYFAGYSDEIRRQFNVGMASGFAWISRDVQSVVGIHVRRGDYLSFPEHHPPLTMAYYSAAMERFPGHDFQIVSDDPGWCLLNFPRARCQISTGKTAVQDMAVMSACHHQIIANSSFSWWAAWLNSWPDKRVIAPAAWFGPAKADWDTKDLIPESWERI